MIKIIFISLCLAITLTSCVQKKRPDIKRTIIINGENHTEKSIGDFWSWRCNDNIKRGNTIIEVGLIGTVANSTTGYILYDGSNKGTNASYRRTGLNHRWDWGPNTEYSFIIKPDGTGLYYDFSTVGKGESTKADDVFECWKY